MPLKTDIYHEIKDFTPAALDGTDHFVYIYGSYATSQFRPDSDLDIMFAVENYNQADFQTIKEFVVTLHTKHGLTVDEEVPYKNKLLIPYQDIDEAAKLAAFKTTGHDEYTVPAIPDDPALLGSQNVRARLVLNALTTPHVFVTGNEASYQNLRAKCEKALVRLACGLTDSADPSPADLQEALFKGQNGETGQAHLGYKTERPEVVTYICELIGRNI